MNILIEIFGLLISIIILILLSTSGDGKSKLNRLFRRTVICNAAVLLSDMAAWAFDGDTRMIGMVVVRVGKFLNYSLLYLMIPLLADYMITLIERNAKTSRAIPRLMYGLCALAVFLVAVSQFNDMYYSFDEHNMYRVGEFFWLSQAFGISFLSFLTAVILKHRKSLGLSDTLFLLSYAFFPLLAVIIQTLVNKEFEFVFIASTLSAIAGYGGIQSRQEKLFRQEEYERARILLNSAPLSCQLWDKNFNIIDCNDENVRFFRLKDKRDFFVRSGLGFVPEKQPGGGSSHELALAYNKRAFAGERLTFEWVQLIEGELIPVEVTLNPVKLGTETFMTAYVRDIREQKRIRELEKELTQKQIAIMFSQIKPHFLYNCLSVIQDLCVTDPQAASRTVSEFAKYLRGNLDSISLTGTVPFERELKHVEIYLTLEKKRFEHKLNIVYDIKARNFNLPALTIQPIAENAVRHGVNKLPKGGTVTIATSETETDYLITVTDDGVGFRVRGDDGKTHVGLENVRSRLASMCGGSLDLRSEPGVGTTAIITIPKETVRI